MACDLFIVLGSSLVVYPAAGFPRVAKRKGAKLVIVNRDPTDQDDDADLVMHDEIGPTMRPGRGRPTEAAILRLAGVRVIAVGAGRRQDDHAQVGHRRCAGERGSRCGDRAAQDITFFRILTGGTVGTYFPIGGLIANAISNPPGSRPCDDGARAACRAWWRRRWRPTDRWPTPRAIGAGDGAVRLRAVGRGILGL